MKKVYLFGRHANRTPFAYSGYAQQLRKHFEYVTRPEDADFLVLGFSIDIRENAREIARIQALRPQVQLVVVSEEPLWDTVWSGDFLSRKTAVNIGDQRIEYHVLNHCTTKIFDFVNIPYFLTTNDDYFVRYANFFKRNRQYTVSKIRALWSHAPIQAAFYAENRIGEKFDIVLPEHDIYGLCNFRTQIATSYPGQKVIRVGQGWGETVKRQAVPDWHLDKLTALDGNSYIVSAIENTHQQHYVTEKIFDAFSVMGVPLYFSSSLHGVSRLLPEGAFVNLFGLSVQNAIMKAMSFEPNNEFVESYRQAQVKLADMFSDPSVFILERQRAVSEIVAEFQQLN